MNKQSLDKLELDMGRRLKRLDKKKRKRMKVSGAGVRGLQRIIIAK